MEQRGAMRYAMVVFLPLLFLALSVAGEQEDPYLTAAFNGLEKTEYSKPSREQQEHIRQTVASIKAAAQARSRFRLSEDAAASIGRSGIPEIAPLLRDADPHVRWTAGKVLLALDCREGAAFLVGLLLDDGELRFADGGRPSTVGNYAASVLSHRMYHTFRARLPATEEVSAIAERKALQSWFANHIPYYEWRKDQPKGGAFWRNDLALHTSTPVTELAKAQREQPDQFKQVLVIWPEDYTPHARFAAGKRIRLRILFENCGTETTWIRWDRTDRSVHVLRLVGPGGEVPPERSESIAQPLGERVPLLQPIWGDGAVLGPWKIDLAEVYDLSQPGLYRLYYTYRPPPDAKPEEQAAPCDLRFWDGCRYVNYYEFMIEKEAEPRGAGTEQ